MKNISRKNRKPNDNVLSNENQNERHDEDINLELEFSNLARKFDRLSIAKKQKMIDMFDEQVEARLNAENPGAPDVVKEALSDMKTFFQNRLAEAEADE